MAFDPTVLKKPRYIQYPQAMSLIRKCLPKGPLWEVGYFLNSTNDVYRLLSQGAYEAMDIYATVAVTHGELTPSTSTNFLPYHEEMARISEKIDFDPESLTTDERRKLVHSHFYENKNQKLNIEFFITYASTVGYTIEINEFLYSPAIVGESGPYPYSLGSRCGDRLYKKGSQGIIDIDIVAGDNDVYKVQRLKNMLIAVKPSHVEFNFIVSI